MHLFCLLFVTLHLSLIVLSLLCLLLQSFYSLFPFLPLLQVIVTIVTPACRCHRLPYCLFYCCLVYILVRIVNDYFFLLFKVYLYACSYYDNKVPLLLSFRHLFSTPFFSTHFDLMSFFLFMYFLTNFHNSLLIIHNESSYNLILM